MESKKVKRDMACKIIFLLTILLCVWA